MVEVVLLKAIVENVIVAGNFELNDMLRKIDTLWAQGSLTDDDRTSLIAMAQEKAKPENTYAPLQTQIDLAFETIREMRVAMEANARGLASLKEAVEKLGGTIETPTPEPGEEWPEFVQPQGAHDAYYNGDKITFDGKHYVCTAPSGTACVWSPAAYPAYWEQRV